MPSRVIERKRLLDITKREIESEPVLFESGLEYVLNGILNDNDINVLDFDLRTRQLTFNTSRGEGIQKQAVIYTRRLIAAFAFDNILPEEIENKVNAAFAYDKSGRAAHFAATHSDGKERLYWDLRSLISRSRSSKIYVLLGRSYDAHVACVYGLLDALDARGRIISNPEYAPEKWGRQRIEEEIDRISGRANEMLQGLTVRNKEISGLYWKAMAKIRP